MKYIIRSLKYFVKLTLILAAVIFIMVQMKLVEGNLDTMFVNGKDSLWQIALMLLAFSAVYPRFGYCTREVVLPGSTEEILPQVKKVMKAQEYKLQSEDGEDFVYCKRSIAIRILKMGEDTITLKRTMSGYNIEGISKDVMRLIAHFNRNAQ